MRCAPSVRVLLPLALALLAAVVWAAPGTAQQRGQISGKVTEAASGRPLPGAQVFVPGTGLGTLTGQNGDYVLAGVPAGPATVRVSMLGYSGSDEKVTVPAGGAAHANFELHQTAVALNEIVVTGAGVQTERRKLGNTVASVNVAKLAQTSSAKDVTSLLQARVPGVTMESSGGLAGEGMRISIRGGSSITQYNQPIVYVDGVRVDNGGGWVAGVSAGGTADPSRLADINPDDIDHIEVLKGAAAATLYGTEASSGVIEIFTKHGASGQTRYDVQLQEGISGYPSHAYGPLSGFVTTPQWAAYESKYWGIPITPYQAFNVDIVPWAYETGHSHTASLGVSGGSSMFQYYVSGRLSYVNGPFGGAKHFTAPNYRLAQDIDNHQQANASLTFFPTDKLHFRVTSNYAEGYHEAPQVGNNILASFSQLIDSKPEYAGCAGFDSLDVGNIAGPLTCKSAFPANQTGVRAFSTAREGWQILTWQNSQTFNGSINGNWQILPTLTADATFGLEHVALHGVTLFPFDWNVDQLASASTQGERTVGTEFDHQLTMDAHVGWDANIGSSLTSSAVLGTQVFETQTNSGYEDGQEFPGPGIDVASAAAIPTIYESYLKEVQLGLFGQEQVGWKNFAFLTLGARFDKHSAFGASAPSVVYPKASLSIVPSSLPSWRSTTLSTFRLRAALGESGRQPGAFDKFTTFAPQAASTGPGLIPDNLGNQNLKPEISTEIEAGTDLGLFRDRVSLNLTYWHHTVNDLLYPRQYAPSGGFINQQLSNIGQMKAHGYELGLNAQVLQHKNLGLNLFANAAFLHQIVTDLGGAPPIKVGGSYPRPRNFIKVGYAPGAFFGAVLLPTPAGTYPISVNAGCTPATKQDLLAFLANPIDPGKLHVLVKGGDYKGGPGCPTRDFLANYEGKPTPDWSGAFGGTLHVLQHFALTGTFEYKLGNYTLENLWQGFSDANPLIGRNNPLAAQTTATLENPASTPEQRLDAALTWAHKLDALAPVSGLNEFFNGDFIRLREVDLTYDLPTKLAQRIRARNASLTLSGRNIWMWTTYPGADPEMNYQGLRSGSGSAVDNINNNFLMGVNGWGLPLPHEFTLALRASF